ncbi:MULTISPECIES: NUDIX domain-containing protein [Sphingomonas]|uniref:NUDIX domain-containing protein n=1 Tax=Sphingomonas TaxID=13687 RepID=UPI0013B45098|nr:MULTISPECIES: NUDIX domain-containing protein [Sphingomonas]
MLTRLLHFGVNAFQILRRSFWFVARPHTKGVHGIPLTPDGRLVLVTLSYAKGWRLPGGGLKPNEDPATAMLRELGEEIGLISHTTIEPICEFEHRPDFRHGEATLFIVRGVRYRPRWSLEIKAVAEFDPADLPADTAAITRRLLALAAGRLGERR